MSNHTVRDLERLKHYHLFMSISDHLSGQNVQFVRIAFPAIVAVKLSSQIITAYNSLHLPFNTHFSRIFEYKRWKYRKKVFTDKPLIQLSLCVIELYWNLVRYTLVKRTWWYGILCWHSTFTVNTLCYI